MPKINRQKKVDRGTHSIQEIDRPTKFKIICEYLKKSNGIFRNDKIILELLPYYFAEHARVGSFAYMASTNMQVLDPGVYSIYFVVAGKKWFREHWYSLHDPSQCRFVHDCIFVGS